MINKLLREQIDTYLKSKELTWSKSTLYAARGQFNSMIRWEWNSPEELHAIMVKKNYGPYTIRTYLYLMAGFDVRFKEYLKNNHQAFRHAYVEKKKKVTRADLYAALAETKHTDHALYNTLILAAYSGLRISEIVSLNKLAMNRKDGVITVTGKGGKVRNVPCNFDLFEYENREHEYPDFLTKASQIRWRWPRALAGFGPHDLRAFFITELVNEPGINVKDAAEVAGHSSILTTSRYIRPDFDKVTAAIKRIANGGNHD
jgi:integrase